ncbi:hypothetical protein G6659_02185 [Polynucleobacter paneuropaeus]|jgi:hypothetical protein|nr:hypothetical protein G6659_02185 [Polynucleobacter paneuropaeus]
MKKIFCLTLIALLPLYANAESTLTIQCDALNGIYYGVNGKGVVSEHIDGFSPKSSTTIIWKVGAKTATISSGDAKAKPTTEIANLVNLQKKIISWTLTNSGATELWTYNIPTKTLLYSSHIQQYDLDGGVAGTVFVANCRAGTN